MHQVLALRIALTLKTLPYIVLEVSGTLEFCIAISVCCLWFIMKYIITFCIGAYGKRSSIYTVVHTVQEPYY